MNKYAQLNKTAENSNDSTVASSYISDADIITKVKINGFIAYGSLVKRYNQSMFRVARSIVTDDHAAMDIVQEAHIKAYSKLETFKGISSFAAWIASVTRNEALMYLRKNKKEVVMGEYEQSLVESLEVINSRKYIQNQPEQILQNKHIQKLINNNLDKLSEKFRSVFVLRAVEQFSTKETAKILNLNEITVKTRYFRSKHYLRIELEKHIDTSDLNIYEFGNKNCDIVLQNVMNSISQL